LEELRGFTRGVLGYTKAAAAEAGERRKKRKRERERGHGHILQTEYLHFLYSTHTTHIHHHF
jgi:hypothetical protein